ncbi:MAG: hypothetical protein KC414_06310, partial [Romboutsia sp.]|nr:hypothetical protein [Romboutsia sp.]
MVNFDDIFTLYLISAIFVFFVIKSDETRQESIDASFFYLTSEETFYVCTPFINTLYMTIIIIRYIIKGFNIF